MRIFFSVGEPSGDVHGGNLIRALQEQHPGVECVGFGGDRMVAAGAKLMYPLSQLAVMGITRVLAHAPAFLNLLSQTDRHFRHHRPDAVVLIDYPGFNWWVARRAHFHRIPVFYFVPPQIWSWASWRVEKMRRFVDHVLCSLPFEKPWYAERGVQAQYVGHPFFDEVPRQILDPVFMQAQRQHGGPIIGLLPGSRTQELERNLTTQMKAAQAIHRARPDTRFLVACFKASHQKMANDCLRRFPGLPAETHVGRTPEIIELAHSCVSVSGSVSLELLHRDKPTVIVYRCRKLSLMVAKKFFMKVKYITLVNLLADRELFPEFLTSECAAEPVSQRILHWLNDEAAYAQRCQELAELRQQVAMPGACERTARFILETLTQPKRAAA
jgi:lipid-A-disaccharide synthase